MKSVGIIHYFVPVGDCSYVVQYFGKTNLPEIFQSTTSAYLPNEFCKV